ncbi:stage V sporulation protein B [Desulfotomaculum nigrificans CO-1-SRB]|uniref:Stage V sporulation protein B n=1 Tax=Desulfotomaculum nigrificans (strain DSM 14880 / VKM B-2319 / CO-1-SRB) TaxID=868595 RepID=F6B591_DESCC|nr:stage V sporulation protein B [Desulfotomaculum nigrificans]AEF94212.1 stage V sporulation protein B [Desulfotomaculum nigrificans CO-1-SRB]
MSRQSFVYGALILLAASFINRIIGFIYQMILIRLIKPEGIGLFNMVFPVYVLVLVLATMGIPVAIAKLVAEEMAKNNIRGANRIFKICLSILIVSSTSFTILLVLASPLLLKYVFPNPKVYYLFLCLVPAVIVVSICSAFRGYFQGLQQMAPTAITQTLEQLVRVIAGLTIAYLLLPRGVEYAAIGVSLGVVIGEFTGCLTMIYLYFSRRQRVPKGTNWMPEPFINSCSRIFSLGIPITLSRFVSTLLMSADAILIPRRLQEAGFSLNEATSIYGQLAGIAETLLFTPTMITIALATALVPAISDALALQNRHLVLTRTSKALRITIGAGLPCVVAFILLPRELCGVLFGYADAGIILGSLAFGGPFLYFQQTTTGILQGMGEAVKPFKNLVIASVFKILGLYYLTAVPSLGILGSALALNVGYLVMALLNYLDLRMLIGYRINLSHDIIKPGLAAIGMAVSVWQIKLLLLPYSALLTLVIALTTGCLVYLILLFLLGGIHRKDFRHIKDLISQRF